MMEHHLNFLTQRCVRCDVGADEIDQTNRLRCDGLVVFRDVLLLTGQGPFWVRKPVGST